jgi:hypothetical protein
MKSSAHSSSVVAAVYDRRVFVALMASVMNHHGGSAVIDRRYKTTSHTL